MPDKSSVDVVTFLTDDDLKIKFSQKAWHDADVPSRHQGTDVVVTTEDGEHVHAVVDRKRRHLGHINVHLDRTLLPTF